MFASAHSWLTETQEQSVHRHRVDIKEDSAYQICSNHHNHCWHSNVVQSNLVDIAAQIKIGDCSHAQSDQHFGQEKQETCDLKQTKSMK